MVRFATKEYSNKPEDIDDKYRHITNFSVNKGNKDFVYNEKPGGDINLLIGRLNTFVHQVNMRVTSGTS